MNIDIEKIHKFVNDIHIDMTEEDMLDILKMTRRWPYKYHWGQESVEILTNFGRKHSCFFDGDHYLNYDAWKKFYDRGFLTMVVNCLDTTKKFRQINEFITDTTGGIPCGNAYFSKGAKDIVPSWDPHEHRYWVIVKQIYGTCTWKLGDDKFDLAPQQSIVIPPGVPHAVINHENKRLSLTINLDDM